MMIKPPRARSRWRRPVHGISPSANGSCHLDQTRLQARGAGDSALVGEAAGSLPHAHDLAFVVALAGAVVEPHSTHPVEVVIVLGRAAVACYFGCHGAGTVSVWTVPEDTSGTISLTRHHEELAALLVEKQAARVLSQLQKDFARSVPRLGRSRQELLEIVGGIIVYPVDVVAIHIYRSDIGLTCHQLLDLSSFLGDLQHALAAAAVDVCRIEGEPRDAAAITDERWK